MNKGHLTYFNELESYSISSLDTLLGKGSTQELLDLEVIKKNNNTYQFRYVGVITIKDTIIGVLPKYTGYYNWDDPQKFNHFKLIIQSLIIYSKSAYRKHNDEDYLSDADSVYNEAASAYWLLEDFLSNGLWNEYPTEKVLNGGNEIDWDHTINNINPIIQNGNPYYVNYYTNEINWVSENVITQIHEWALYYCNNKYASILGFPITYFYPLEKGKIGSDEYIISKIDEILHEVFDDRKIQLLKRIKLLIQKKSEENSNYISLFGTKKFDTVWEEACKEAFYDQYEEHKIHIESPIWKSTNEKVLKTSAKHIPDILHNHDNAFLVLDAKYYNVQIKDESIDGHPNLGDITKQFIYAHYFNRLCKEKPIINCFLFPNIDNEFTSLKHIGYVDLPLEIFEGERIFNIYISPKELLEMYVGSKNKRFLEQLLTITLPLSTKKEKLK
ncbi:LlaJI family restriction endonuclease [Flammeovirga sp. SubArs3]|uniref:LlaJI family restriction endonuclease n=1 Tax=Flammeovirga sp. SubArs3 TaxID=2995316 RepID=UPI00248CFC89|nr:LlaJI family restriction endonuclease [Flammeovirga sp. SubArs3]